MPATQLLPFFLLFLLSISPSEEAPLATNPYHNNCAPFVYRCGTATFNISYPFHVGGQPDHCGHPDFYLHCTSNNTLTISISNKDYQVTAVDYPNTLLTIVDTAFANQSCPQPYQNTSIDPTMFQYSDRDRNLYSYINCTAAVSSIPSIANECWFGSTRRYSYYSLDNGTMPEVLGSCDSMVWVPVSQDAAEKLGNGSDGYEKALQEGFDAKWMAGMGWCDGCESSGGRCGYNSSFPDQHTCYCANGAAIEACTVRSQGKSGTSKSKELIIGLTTGFTSFIIIGCLVLILRRQCHKNRCEVLHFWNKKTKNEKTIKAFLEDYGSLGLKHYTYSDVKKMTKSFKEKLGQGGYGSVFKGKLFDGRLVAVKVLSESKGDGEDFINEVAAIGRTSHVNVVSLLGFCAKGSKRALIYDFMPNGSLDKYIHPEKMKAESSLGWEKLYEIAIGIARGLEYLHQGCNIRIVHFDIKPHNILLDQDFRPKISDFGMAKLCRPKESIISMYGLRGTIGYISPEVFSRTYGAVSSKSDVYSYGMMLLEMFGGRRNTTTRLDSASETYFPQWIYVHLEKNDDLMASGVTSECEEIARKMITVGFWCIQTLPEQRPSISRVVEMLEGNIKELPIPPKPRLSSPLDLIDALGTISSS